MEVFLSKMGIVYSYHEQSTNPKLYSEQNIAVSGRIQTQAVNLSVDSALKSEIFSYDFNQLAWISICLFLFIQSLYILRNAW